MEKVFANFEKLGGSLSEYVNSRPETIKYQAARKISLIISNAVGTMVVGLVFAFFLGLVSIALSYLLGEWVGKIWAGFLIVGGLYFFTGIAVWTARKWIIKIPVMNAVMRNLLAEDEED